MQIAKLQAVTACPSLITISQTAGPVCVRAQSDGQLHGIKVTETQPYSFPPLQTNIAKLRKLKNFTHTHIAGNLKLDTLHKHCCYFLSTTLCTEILAIAREACKFVRS